MWSIPWEKRKFVQWVCSWYHIPCFRPCRAVSFCCHWPVPPGSVDFRSVKCGSWQTGGIAVVQHEAGPESGLLCQLFVPAPWWDQCKVCWEYVFRNFYSNLTWASQVAQWWRSRLPVQQMQEMQFDLWVRKISWRRKWEPIPVFLPGKLPGRGAWWATVHGVKASRTWLSSWTHTHTVIRIIIYLLNLSKLWA